MRFYPGNSIAVVEYGELLLTRQFRSGLFLPIVRPDPNNPDQFIERGPQSKSSLVLSQSEIKERGHFYPYGKEAPGHTLLKTTIDELPEEYDDERHPLIKLGRWGVANFPDHQALSTHKKWLSLAILLIKEGQELEILGDPKSGTKDGVEIKF